MKDVSHSVAGSGPSGGRRVRVALGLGANLGCPEEHIRKALSDLAEGGLEEVRCAPLYVTRPVDCDAGTPEFLNTVVCGWWRGSARELLALCRRIEERLGRPRVHSRRAARVIDVDLLLVGEERLSEPGLEVPHPALRDRLFVLVPLADLAPDWRLPPGMETVAEARDRALRAPGAEGWGRRYEG